MSKQDYHCHIELGDYEEKWWWRMDVWNPGVTIRGDWEMYTSFSSAKRAATRVAKKFGIRVDSFGVYGKKWKTNVPS